MRHPLRLALGFAWMTLGCGAPTPGVEASGVYFVPPRSASSSYAVNDVSWRIEAGVARLSYTLPRLLVGGSGRVSFSGAAGAGPTYALSGSDGTATCTLAPSAGVALRCDERFTGLRVDLDGVRTEALRSDPAAVEARVAVSRGFSIEPIGVLEVPTL